MIGANKRVTSLRDPSLTEDASVLDLRREEPEIELLDPAEVRRLPRSAIARLPVVDPSTGLLAANGAELRFKRVVDVGTTLLAMALLSPVFLLVALAVWVTSRGPVFYVSDRVGRHGDGFKVLKFRSMYVDAEYRKAELEELNEMSGPVFKMKSDPRVTPVGRIIRKLSLDELPQLLHVLTGEMSLVGPRPAIPAEVETYDDQERQRLLVKPGITCIWQVSGRNDVDFDTWMRMDLDYIQNWTPWLDVSLLFRTVPAVVFGRGAY